MPWIRLTPRVLATTRATTTTSAAMRTTRLSPRRRPEAPQSLCSVDIVGSSRRGLHLDEGS